MTASADEAGFEEYVVARRAALLRTAYLLTGDHADAEDLVQAALVKAVPHWRRISADPEPYVRRILTRESISRWRRRRWREVSTDRLPDRPTDGGTATGVDDRVVQREALRLALLTLAPRQRAVVVLRYYEQLSEKETAEALGVTVGTIKSQSSRALDTLRTSLGDQFGPSAGITGWEAR